MAVTVSTFAKMKAEGRKISMLTAYDYSTAKLIDESGIDSILVGDSLGNVVLGYPNTLAVTVDDMIHHGAAVCRGAKNALVVIDMPFMSYQTSTYDALVNAGRIMKETGCTAVKLEGGVEVEETIRAIVAAGIPVCAHVGLTPQSINAFGGFKSQGRTIATAEKLARDLAAVERAGAFACVVEGVPAALMERLYPRVGDMVIIGIGAGAAGTDGQVLVYQDMLGLFSDFTPKFAKRFVEAGAVMREGFAAYDAQVKDGSFPAAEQCYAVSDEVLAVLTDERLDELMA